MPTIFFTFLYIFLKCWHRLNEPVISLVKVTCEQKMSRLCPINRFKGITLHMTHVNTYVELSTKNSTIRNVVNENLIIQVCHFQLVPDLHIGSIG
jgi:hypothetical protein